MTVSLTPELEKWVQAKVASGMYNSASELVREALRLIEERDELRQRRIEVMDAFIQEGLDSAASMRTMTPEEIEADNEKFWQELDTIINDAEKLHGKN